MNVARRVDAWLLAPAPPERLAAFRVLVGLFATLYLAIRAPAFLLLADPEASGTFDPVGVLWFLARPLPAGVVVGAFFVTLAAGVAFTLGAWFRVSGPLFALGLLALTTYRSSWGQILWLEILVVLHALIVGFTRAADAWAWPRRGATAARRATDGATYGWPLRLAALVTVTTYVLAGVAKLRYGGVAWMFGDSLRNQVAYSAARLDLLGAVGSPFGRLASRYGWLFPPAAVATVALELGAPVALWRRARVPWVVGAWAMHLSIGVLMFVVFPYPLVLVAFAPLFELDELARRARARVCRVIRKIGVFWSVLALAGSAAVAFPSEAHALPSCTAVTRLTHVADRSMSAVIPSTTGGSGNYDRVLGVGNAGNAVYNLQESLNRC